MKLLVNIRGCNGAGKSTIPMSMMNDKKQRVISVNGNNKAPFITVFPTYMWVALGTYYNKTGGMDTLANNEAIRQALEYALNHYPVYDILMEGVIASTIKSTYANLFHDIEGKVRRKELTERKVLVMNFLPPVEECIRRVYERNGGKPVKEDQIRSKWNTVNRNVDYFRQEGFTSLRINNAKVSKDHMLVRFLETCDKYREE